MACFIVPLTQAIATTAYRKHVEKKSQLESEKYLSPFIFHLSAHLKTLELMLSSAPVAADSSSPKT